MLDHILPSPLNKAQERNLLAQNKNHSQSDIERFSHCYSSGFIPEYMKKSSQFDKLYDFIDIEDKRFFSAGGNNYIVAKEKPTHNNWPAFRIFSVDNNGQKSHVASILDYFGGGYTLYNHNGDIISEKSYVRETPMIRVFDETMTGYTADMEEVRRISDLNHISDNAAIAELHTKGKFATWHTNFINNFGEFLSTMANHDNFGYSGAKDKFLNADKYMTFEDVTPDAMKNSELRETGVFSIHNKNLLEINTSEIEGAVPLFKNEIPDIKPNDSSLNIRFKHFGPAFLTEQENQFLKAVARFLTELNKIATTKFDYLAIIRQFTK